MTDQLFEGYGTPTPPKTKRQPVELPTEPHHEPWIVVRDRRGVFPFFHLVKCQLTHGSVATLCGLKGSKLSNLGVDYMVRCPSCDIAEQLS